MKPRVLLAFEPVEQEILAKWKVPRKYSCQGSYTDTASLDFYGGGGGAQSCT